MSDGPYRSLPMRHACKRLAKRAQQSAFDPEQVADAVCPALEAHWADEVSDAVSQRLREICDNRQPSFLQDEQRTALDAARRDAAGAGTLCAVLVDCVEQALAEGKIGEEALIAAAKDALLKEPFAMPAPSKNITTAKAAREAPNAFTRASSMPSAVRLWTPWQSKLLGVARSQTAHLLITMDWMKEFRCRDEGSCFHLGAYHARGCLGKRPPRSLDVGAVLDRRPLVLHDGASRVLPLGGMETFDL